MIGGGLAVWLSFSLGPRASERVSRFGLYRGDTHEARAPLQPKARNALGSSRGFEKQLNKGVLLAAGTLGPIAGSSR